MRVLALMKYGAKAASTRQRLLQYLPYLASHGIDVETAPLLGDGYVEALASGRRANVLATATAYAYRLQQLVVRRDFDLVWVHLETFPNLPGWFETLAGISGKPVVYDFDDAIFHKYDDHPRALMRRFMGRKLEPLLREAAACICGNAYLQAYAQQFSENSIIVPTVVDTSAYTPGGKAPADQPLTVGWIGSPSTWTHYTAPLLPIILPLLRRHQATFRAVGAGPAAKNIRGIEAVDWSEESEITEVQRMDIGIMPLPDESWARGKCGYKLIQYMACGLPVVASPVGVNSDIVIDGENGFLATGGQEWLSALDKLLGSEALRLEMGRHGRKRVEERYSLSVHAPRILNVLKSVAGASGAKRLERS